MTRQFYKYCPILVFSLLIGLNQVIAQTKAEKLEQFKENYDLIEGIRFKYKDSANVLANENFKLAQEINDDFILAKALYQLGSSERRIYQYNESISHYEQSLSLLENSDSLNFKARVMSGMALSFGSLGEHEKAVSLGKKVIPLTAEDPKAHVLALYNIGLDYKRFGNIDSAEHYLMLARDGAVEHEIKRSYIFINNVLGNIKSDEGQYRESLKFAQESLRTAEEIKDSIYIATVLSNIAIIYKRMEEYDRATDNYKRSIWISELIDDDYVHFAMYNLAILYYQLEEFEKAIKYFKKALSIRESIGELRYVVTASSQLAKIYSDVNNKDSSAYYVSYSEDLLTKVTSKSAIAPTLEILGEINLDNNELVKAENQFIRAYGLYKEIRIDESLMDVSYSLYEINKRQGDTQKSLSYLEEHLMLKDSIINEENIMEVARLDENYKHEKEILQKQNEIALLESKEEIANLRVTILIIGILAVIVVAFLIARFLLLKKERKKRALEQLSRYKESMTSMIAHDLKTPLSIIRNTESDPNTRQMSEQMLFLINNMLDVHRFESTEVQLKKERLSLLDLLLKQKEQLSYLLINKNLTFDLPQRDFDIEADKTILERILNNLLTNAIKYSPFNETITIVARSIGDRLTLAVNNKGATIPEDRKEMIFESFEQLDPRDSGGVNSTGLGLSFVRLALEVHGSEIKVESNSEEGTTFSFELPLIEGAGTGAQSEGLKIELSREAKSQLAPEVENLKSYKLYNIGDIEQSLSNIKDRSPETDRWIEELLTAVYAGNEKKYQEMLEEIE